MRTDVTDPRDCHALVRTAMDEFGRVDILVSNAGVGTAVPATRETPEQFRSVVDLNLNGCYWMVQECGRVMRPGSSIINLSSVLGLTTAGLPQAAYASSKAGLIGLTRDLALQWTGRRGIRVNAIAPGYSASEMTDQFDTEYFDSTILPRTLCGRNPKSSAPHCYSSPATPAATSPESHCPSKAACSPPREPFVKQLSEACSERRPTANPK